MSSKFGIKMIKGYFIAHDNQRSWDFVTTSTGRRSIEPLNPATRKAYPRVLWVFSPVKELDGSFKRSAQAVGYAVFPKHFEDLEDILEGV